MPHTKPAFDYLEEMIPFFTTLKPENMLYVGWRHDCKPWWHDTFARRLTPFPVGVLEVFPKNAQDFESEVWLGRYEGKVICGDVREIEKYVPEKCFDIIFWDHGPEHVTKEELHMTTQKLLKHAGKLLVYACPWGDWPQGAEDGNQHEIHQAALSPEDFRAHGMEVKTFGSPGQQGGGEIVAWKVIQ